MRVLIIGLDGVTWDVLDDYLLQNYMPNLNKLKTGGYSGVLKSTEPPTTSAAWTSMLTGCNPENHGVMGYQKYSFKNDLLSILNSTHNRVSNLWQQLSKQGYKIVSINVPWTYPCYEINGIMTAGFGSPGPSSQFTYPKEFREQLLSEIPDYDIKAECDWSSVDNPEKFRQDVEKVKRSFQQKLEAAQLCSNLVNWDIMMVQFQDIDKMHHNIWPLLGSGSRDKYSSQRDVLFELFESLDKIIYELINCNSQDELFVIVISDHGGCKLKGAIRPNILLHKWGYLRLKAAPLREFSRFFRRRKQNQMKKRTDTGIKETKMRQPYDLNINWNRTKAVMLHMAINGYVYLNLKGRNKKGCVNPAKYDETVEDLKEKFSRLKEPGTNRPLFKSVIESSELYGTESSVSDNVGDLVLIPQEGYETRTSVSKRKGYLEPAKPLAGTHNHDGIYILSGPNVKPSGNKPAKIIDIAPTVYALLGAKLPTYMDGRVLQEVFCRPLDICYMDESNEVETNKKTVFSLSKREEEQVNKRLKELGYI